MNNDESKKAKGEKKCKEKANTQKIDYSQII